MGLVYRDGKVVPSYLCVQAKWWLDDVDVPYRLLGGCLVTRGHTRQPIRVRIQRMSGGEASWLGDHMGLMRRSPEGKGFWCYHIAYTLKNIKSHSFACV